MTNKEILQADLLDILFEHRNKLYGAYTLRRHYNSRLFIALGIALSMVGLFLLFALLKENSKERGSLPGNDDNLVTLTQIEIEKIKKIDPVVLPKKTEPIMERNYQPIIIVEDKLVPNTIVDRRELVEAAISTRDVDGKIQDGPAMVETNNTKMDTGNKVPDSTEQSIVPVERMPSFPGGNEALALFFSVTLSAPADLEAGEKKVVLVRFVVGADGAVTNTEIIKSGGDVYDREVIRAFKRMPRWNPGIQNGNKIAFSFTQPVTFVGIEQ